MPKLDQRLLKRLDELLLELESLLKRTKKLANSTSLYWNDVDGAQCEGWMTTALATVEIICPETNSYRQRIKQFVDRAGDRHNRALAIGSMLRNLVRDAREGLLTNLGDVVRAETFVEFLDHGRAYVKANQKMESGVIVGVVFEDTVRRLHEKYKLAPATEDRKKLDELISDLCRVGKITAVQAKRARVGAHVRTKATHADWGEFELGDVEVTLRFTEDLIDQHLS